MSQHHLSEQEVESIISMGESTLKTKDHLAQCTLCQNEVDKASADQWWWNEGRELIASTVKLKERFGSPPKSTQNEGCLLYTSPSPRDQRGSRMPSSA